MITPSLTLEQQLWSQGFVHVAGVDEAGKGPLAGPVTAGAVVIHNIGQVVDGVKDSKLLSIKQRETLFDKICKRSTAFGIGVVSSEEIDLFGIDRAVKKAMVLALSEIEGKLGELLSFVIVDGSKTRQLEMYQNRRILKGGLYHYSIAAGSILAKVTRDRIMKDIHLLYPQYGFSQHVGYGTKKHREALQRYGPCPIHRKSFQPIKSMIQGF